MSPQISRELLQGRDKYRKVNYRGQSTIIAETPNRKGFLADDGTIFRELFSARRGSCSAWISPQNCLKPLTNKAFRRGNCSAWISPVFHRNFVDKARNPFPGDK